MRIYQLPKEQGCINIKNIDAVTKSNDTGLKFVLAVSGKIINVEYQNRVSRDAALKLVMSEMREL